MNVVLANALTGLAPSLFMDAVEPQVPAGSGAFQTVIMVFLVLIALFFIFILPARSRDKQTQKMIDAIKIGDKVLTTGGVIGVVCSVSPQEGEIVLRIDDSNNVKVHFALSSVYFVFNKEAAKKEKENKDKGSK